MTENQSVNVEMKPNISSVDGGSHRPAKPVSVEAPKSSKSKSTSSMRETQIKSYKLLKTIGKGNFGKSHTFFFLLFKLLWV